jgi:hypothetical protein
MITAKGKGKLRVQFKLRDASKRTEQIDVLHVRALGNTNLFSVKDAVKVGHKMVFTEYGCEIRNRFDVLTGEGELGGDDMYNFNLKAISPASAKRTRTGGICNAGPSKGISLELAHNRILHRNERDLKLMVECTEGLRINDRTGQGSLCFCEA